MADEKKPTKSKTTKSTRAKTTSTKKAAPKSPAKKTTSAKTAKTTAVKSTAKKSPAKTTKKTGRATAPVVFMTGFPGFIGRRLVERLFETRPDISFIFLVQKKFEPLAVNTLRHIAERHPQAADRCEIVFGDITKAHLGLSDEDRHRVTERATQVWHLAAIYALGVELALAYRVNVLGTANVMDLCEQCKKLDRFIYYSTCYVSGTRTGAVLEDELEMGQNFKNNYEATKFEAEVIVQERRDRIPTVIIRPAIVIGDSQTGETDKFDGPYALIRLHAFIEEKGLIPRGIPLPLIGPGIAKLNLVPVDYLVKASVQVAFWKDAVGKVFQISDPRPASTREFVEKLHEIYGVGPVRGSLPFWVIRGMAQIKWLRETLDIQTDTLVYMDVHAEYDCANTLAALEGSGIELPDIREYLPRIVEFVRRNVRFKGQAKY
ncbi:MAG: SDR family oxidoreductase [Deltaproteobacteria bacterium]|nr:SDR family oxidoreductase [Deltaproteobacteria bacterium]MCB9478542.1 SDR family oxidoreductase [Deltaproteobacteria bacterium]MCB9488377.1 SDR family oxidoreductase [Deltaproteobacteria bacterium]